MCGLAPILPRPSPTFPSTGSRKEERGREVVPWCPAPGLGLSQCLPCCLLSPNVQVCRSAERGQEAVERVRRDSGNNDVHLKASAVLRDNCCLAGAAGGCHAVADADDE